MGAAEETEVAGVWSLAARGTHVVVIGAPGLALAGADVEVLRVDCAASHRPLGAILQAQARLAAAVEQSRYPVALTGRPGQRLAGEHPGQGAEARWAGQNAFVALANRLRRQLEARPVLVFEAADHLDDDSAALLLRATAPDAGLLVSIVLCFADEPMGTRAELCAAVEQRSGPDSIVRIEAPRSVVRGREPVAWQALPFEAGQVLRAAALVGDSFEAEVVGALLGVDPLDVLEVLQLAVDHHIPLDDRDHGVFRFDARLAAELRASVTPSLATAWHGRLAALANHGGAFAGVETREPEELAEQEEPTDEELPPWRSDASRAAEHAEAAGQDVEAAQRYIAAAMQAAHLGAYERALEHLDRALLGLGPRPADARRRRLRAAALITLARVKWIAAVPDEEFTLESALDTAREAAGLLDAGDPAELRAEADALQAHILYDVGEPAALEQALGLLASATAALELAGKPLLAARLLNDEAAIRGRLGEHERAAELLRRSREVFKELAERGDGPRIELAETDMLVARMMLHVKDEDRPALRFALECAESAIATFEELSMPQQQADALETLGRLELLAGRRRRALEHLRGALEIQQQLVDALGLARTTAALAEGLAQAGRCDEALQVLGESAALNRLKGSQKGLEYNRVALDNLVAALDGRERARLAEAIAAVRRQVGD